MKYPMNASVVDELSFVKQERGKRSHRPPAPTINHSHFNIQLRRTRFTPPGIPLVGIRLHLRYRALQSVHVLDLVQALVVQILWLQFKDARVLGLVAGCTAELPLAEPFPRISPLCWI